LRNKFALSSILLIVSVIWGSAFVVMKDTLQRHDVNSFLACRFIIATLFLIAIRPKIIASMSRTTFFRGAVLGLLLGLGYIFQTFGLTHTTVAKTGFITGMYAVFTPLIAAGILKKDISPIQWLSVFIAAVGLAFLSLNGLSLGFGETLVVISAAFYAAHIVGLSEWSSGADTYALTVIQLGTVGVLTLIASLPGGFHLPPDSGVWQAIIYTALFASAFAFIIQTWVQSFMSATSVGIILTMEYIFAALFGVWFGHESLTLRVVIGGLLVISAMYIIISDESRERIEP
jgi:drug/metabolite transporter (DMT)-like permease